MEVRTAVPVKAVGKALDLLDLLLFDHSWERGASLSELAATMQIPANTTHNLLKTMLACGYVSQIAAGRYAPGERCRQIGRLNLLKTAETTRVLLPALRELNASSRNLIRVQSAERSTVVDMTHEGMRA